MKMNEYNHRLGVGLIPGESQISKIYDLAEKLSTQNDLSFWVKPGISVPHVTLFQGRFKSEEEVIKAIKGIDFSYLNSKQALSGLSVWAQKIIFLDCERSEYLQKAHESVYNALFPLCEGKSADPQQFKGITDGQQRSFDKTGYPFSLEEYLPHFTIAHLRNPEQTEKHHFREIFEKSSLVDTVVFDRIVLYRVGDLGKCFDFVYERKLG